MTGSPATTSKLPLPIHQEAGQFTVFLRDRPVRVKLSDRARRAANARTTPLTVEMELFFSCLVRKRLLFHEPDQIPDPNLDSLPLATNLILQFRPIVSDVCHIDELEGAPPVKTMPAKRPDALIPKWVEIDYRAQHWVGEFGY